jgi:hypothetical protein
MLSHRRFAHRSHLTQVHSGNDLAADQVTAVSVSDGERVAPRSVACTEVAFEVRAPELIRRCDFGERFRVGCCAPLLPLWTGEAGSSENIAKVLAAGQSPCARWRLALNDGRTSVAVIELMPRFGRAESIPLLEHLLIGNEATAWAAAQSLALHPQAAAGEALQRSLARREPAIAIIAADALGTRGDRSACAALVTPDRRA